MGEKLVVGPFNKGYRTDREPFVIDNDNFPTLINAYQWRGRIKRKRGTRFLGRLNRYLDVTDGSGNLMVTINPHPIASGVISVVIGTDVFTDQGGASPVTMITNSTGTAVLNRTTGVLTITGSIINTNVFYNPGLPVMGLEDLILETNQFASNLGFDTTYAYNISGAIPSSIYDVSFYKNPQTGPGTYTPKGTWTRLNWNGKDYQQFYTVNYQGALWATNGIRFTNNKPDLTGIGMQFKPIVAVTVTTSGNGTTIPAVVNLQITGHGLVVGDFLFINEVVTTTGINFQTGYVTAVVNANNVTVEFSNAIITTNGTGGIAQYLTNTATVGLDPLRWYDGDPTDGVHFVPSTLNGTSNGWVNFSPPLSQGTYVIAELPLDKYYLVGARMIVPFKDRLLFLGPVVQSSSGTKAYLQDTVIYSQNGTAFYTCSYVNTPSSTVDTPTSATNVFFQILVPTNQTATAPAYFEDQVGFGGFISAGIDEKLNTIGTNEDSLVAGFDRKQTQIVYTGNDVTPFLFYSINSELGSGSTFSTIIMDEGVLTRGTRGLIFTSRTNASRFDLDIIDQAFEINLQGNGTERVTAQRDFINEWIYFTYKSNENDTNKYIFPTQTLQYNYRDNTWAIINESYTTYGAFRPNTGYTWATIGTKYASWNAWTDPWNAGDSDVFQPLVIGGNSQGFVIIKGEGISESISLYIQNISTNTVLCPNHCLNQNDYIIISGVLGAAGTVLNGNIYSVQTVPDANTFTLNPNVNISNYVGGGNITRLYVPLIQTRQFPISWEMARKTRLGPQQYLLSTTDNAQITLFIYLSQNAEFPYNDPTQVTNNSLIYSTVLYTCPESTNLGLTPVNTNLQMLTNIPSGTSPQAQTWHRINTSLIGDTVQLGFTMSDTQMRALDSNGNLISQFSEIEIHGFILDVQPSMLLS